VPAAVIQSIRSAISDMVSKENKLKFVNKIFWKYWEQN